MMHIHEQPFMNHPCQWLECCQSWCVHAIGCEASFQYLVITELQNPVTRSIVQVIPPREISSEDAWKNLAETFTAWCKDQYRDGLKDPKVYDVMPPEASVR